MGSEHKKSSTAKTLQDPPVMMRVNGSSTRRQSQHPIRSLEEFVNSPSITNQFPRRDKSRRCSSNNVKKTFHQPHELRSRSSPSKDERSEQIFWSEPWEMDTTAARGCVVGSTNDCRDRNSILTGSEAQVQTYRKNTPQRGPMSERTQHHSPQRPPRRSRNEIGSFGRLTPDTLLCPPSTNSARSISIDSSRKRIPRTSSRTRQSKEGGKSDYRSPLVIRPKERDVDDTRKRDRYTDRAPPSLLKDGIRTCLRTGQNVGSKVSECLVVSDDMCQQECATQDLPRGDDSLFLTHKEMCTRGTMGSDVSDSRIGRRPTDATEVMSGVFRECEFGDWISQYPSRGDGLDRLVQSPGRFAGDGEGDDSILHQSSNHVRQEQHTETGASRLGLGDSLHLLSQTPPTFQTALVDESADEFVNLRALRLSRFNQDSRLTRYHAGISAFTKTQRTLGLGPALLQPTQQAENNGLSSNTANTPTVLNRPGGLHELQQEDLHGQGSQVPREQGVQGVDGVMTLELPQDALIRSQQGTINTLEKELSTIKKALKQAVEALDQQGSFINHEAVQITAEKLFRERIDVEEKLRKEMRLKDELSDKVKDLEEEMELLRLSLQHAKETTGQIAMNDVAKPSEMTVNVSEGKDSGENDHTLAEVCAASHRRESTAECTRESRRRLLRQKELRLSKLVETLRSGNSDEDPSDRQTLSPTSVMEIDPILSSSSKKVRALRNVQKSPYCDAEAQLKSMKAEVVTLRAQLAEAHAARLSAENRASSLEEHDTVLRDENHQSEDKMKAKSRNIVEHLNEKKFIFESSADTAHQPRSKLKGMQKHTLAYAEQSTIDKEESQGEIEIESVQINVNYSNEEMNSIKEKLRKAEDEARDRAHKLKKVEEDIMSSKLEAEQLRRDILHLESELERERVSSDERLRVSEEETRNLQHTVQQIKEKLAKRNDDIANQAEEHLVQLREMEEALEENKGATEALQKKVGVLESEVATKETEVEALRVLVKKRSQGISFRGFNMWPTESSN